MLFLGCSIVVVVLFSWLLFSDNECDTLLSSVPGPRRLPVFGNIYEYFGLSQAEIFNKTRLFARIYPHRYKLKVLRRRILNILNPDDAEIILSSSKNISKSFVYSFLHSWLHQGLLLSDGAKWHSRRKILTPAFHFNILREFSLIIEENSRRLVQEMERECDRERTDVAPIVSKYALHSICETAMGTQLDIDKSDSARQYKAAIMQIGNFCLQRLTRFWQHPDVIYNRTSNGKKYNKLLQIIHNFPDRVIRNRRNQNKVLKTEVASDEEDVFMKKRKRMAMLDLLLDAESRDEIDMNGIKEEVNTFMFEGHDTTAMAITFALMLLANHKDVQEAAREECCRMSESGVCGVNEMRFLDACIKETLRLYPSVPFISRLITHDVWLNDILVVAGTTCHIHIYDIHRRADLFAEPTAFRPERFLAENLQESRHPYGYIPFSAGPRNCIGQRLAMLQMKYVLSAILRHYSLEPVSRPEDIIFLADLVLRPQGPVYVKFIKRENQKLA